jgi:hypothetical protein
VAAPAKLAAAAAEHLEPEEVHGRASWPIRKRVHASLRRPPRGVTGALGIWSQGRPREGRRRRGRRRRSRRTRARPEWWVCCGGWCGPRRHRTSSAAVGHLLCRG